jgi:hypothetical protein
MAETQTERGKPTESAFPKRQNEVTPDLEVVRYL